MKKNILLPNRNYDIISQYNDMVRKNYDREKLFDEACKIAVETGKYLLAWIGVFDEKNKVIMPHAWYGFGDGFPEEIRKMSVDDVLRNDLGQNRILMGNYYICNNIIKEDSGFILRKHALAHGFCSLMSLPLFLNAKVIGSFNVYAGEPDFFDEDEIKLLVRVAGNISFSLENIHDITNCKRAEEELSNSEILLKKVVHTIPDMVWLKNADGVYLSCNKMIERLFNAKEADIVGKTDYDFEDRESADHFRDYDLKVMAAGQSISYEELVTFADDGHSSFLETIKTPTFNAKGIVIGVMGIGRDITEQKIALQELIAAKENAVSANKLKDAFIANISHEIRTPLNGILGMASLIKDSFQDVLTKEDEELFDGIDISSQRLIRTVDLILNYSRLQVGEYPLYRKKIDLISVCQNLVREYAVEAKTKLVELTFQNDCLGTSVFADEYSVTMAISNLLSNAVKFTTKGFINLTLHQNNNDEIILDVKDTGIGIGEEYLDSIFEPYYQENMGYARAYDGIGLGLALVRKMLDLNNAKIFVKSKKGEGSSFYINFGKVVKSVEKIVETVGIPDIPRAAEKPVVLIVEDDFVNQTTVKRFIENNYGCIIADSSDNAMTILKKGKVDLILMDISINGEMNGLELTKELKMSKEFCHIPVIAITAHAFEEDKQNALDAGCDSFLAKPFTQESLLKIIKVFVNKII